MKECIKVASFVISGIAGHKKGEALIHVEYVIDTDGCMSLEARHSVNDKLQEKLQVVDLLKLTSDELAEMRVNIDSVR